MGILICGDMHKAVRTAEEFWVIDGAIRSGESLLSAHAPAWVVCPARGRVRMP